VVELGVGRGALTRALADRVGPNGRVIGFELDRELVNWLRQEDVLPGNVELRFGDMLGISFTQLADELGGPLVIAGNLPYNISSQVVMKLVEEKDVLRQAVLMFQKEVAERLVAGPGSRKYGILSVLAGQCLDMKKLMDVPPGLFSPRPKVVSSVVEIKPAAAETDVGNRAIFRRVVKQAFAKRRKTVRNALLELYSPCPHLLDQVLARAEIDPRWRAEMISIEKFSRLARLSEEYLDKRV
jgi:16S rRNA (adenine1518-N6/adenine1519-N6)-dimethyltransferase